MTEWWKSSNQNSKKKNILKNESSLRDLWDNIKHTNICIIGVPGEEREKRLENMFDEIMAENFLSWRTQQISRYRKHRESQTNETKETYTKTNN